MTEIEFRDKIFAKVGDFMNKKTTDLRVYRTRKNIKESLISLLEAKPLSEITVTELSEKAIINRKTFYRHYQTVNDVIKDIEGDFVEMLAELLKEKDISCLDASAVLTQIGMFIKLNRNTLEKITRLTPDIFENGRLDELLRHSMVAYLKKNAILSIEKEYEYISTFVVSGLMSLYTNWFKSGCKDDLDLMIDSAERLIAKGMSFYLSEEQLGGFNAALTNAPK